MSTPVQRIESIDGRTGRVDSAEQEVLSLLAGGDYEQALSCLMEAYGARIYGFCLRQVGDPSLAEDVLQTTFIEAHRNLPTYEGRSKLSTWLLGIARHRCVDAVRGRSRARDRFEELDATERLSEVATRARDPNHATTLQDLLDFCLQKLRPELRQLILLRCREGLSYREIEELLSSSATALRARVSRTLPTLRRCLEDNGGFL